MPNIAHQPHRVTIGDTNLNQIMYKGQLVVTFAMIDQVHQKPEGSAGRRFRDNRERFIEGEDFYPLDSNSLGEIRRHAPDAFSASAQHGIVITETGYLMLVKSFTDDLAWQVQRQLVKHYFSASPVPDIPQDVAPSEADLINLSYFGDVSKANLPKKSYHLGVVYALELSNGYIKIGQTTRPDNRISDLSKNYRAFAQVKRVAISKECLNYEEIERQLHSEFAEQRVDGELFRVSLLEVIRAIAAIEFDELPDNASLPAIPDAPSNELDYDALRRKYENLDKTSEHIGAMYWRMGYRDDILENAVEYTLRESGFKPMPTSFTEALAWHFRSFSDLGMEVCDE